MVNPLWPTSESVLNLRNRGFPVEMIVGGIFVPQYLGSPSTGASTEFPSCISNQSNLEHRNSLSKNYNS